MNSHSAKMTNATEAQSDKEALFDAIVTRNPMQKKFIENSWQSLSVEEQLQFCRYLKFCLASGLSHDAIAEAYDVIVKDTFREQVYFKRHGHYRYARYDEVADSVYQNPEYMQNYMVGLAISGYLWPNHVELHRFYQNWINRSHTGQYLEIGPGHGYYFMQAARTGLFDHCQGVDISPASVAMTNNIMSSEIFGPFENYNIKLADFFTWNSGKKYDFIVMAEVLEHVENPQDFLNKLASLLTSSGTLYITTCINSPAIDHIYLYTDIQALLNQVAHAGLIVIDRKVVPYTGQTLAESMKQKLPVNIALVLNK